MSQTCVSGRGASARLPICVIRFKTLAVHRRSTTAPPRHASATAAPPRKSADTVIPPPSTRILCRPSSCRPARIWRGANLLPLYHLPPFLVLFPPFCVPSVRLGRRTTSTPAGAFACHGLHHNPAGCRHRAAPERRRARRPSRVDDDPRRILTGTQPHRSGGGCHEARWRYTNDHGICYRAQPNANGAISHPARKYRARRRTRWPHAHPAIGRSARSPSAPISRRANGAYIFSADRSPAVQSPQQGQPCPARMSRIRCQTRGVTSALSMRSSFPVAQPAKSFVPDPRLSMILAPARRVANQNLCSAVLGTRGSHGDTIQQFRLKGLIRRPKTPRAIGQFNRVARVP